MSSQVDMTHGGIARKTLAFALFVAATGVMQQLFNSMDTFIMGQFVGKEAMAAVGSNIPILSFIVTFYIGISLGANVVISQHTGRGDRAAVSDAVHTSILFALLAGLAMMVVGELLARPVLEILQVPSVLMPLSLKYLRIIFLALPGILLYNFNAAIFRSQGDTRTPLVCLVIAGVIKVIISFTLVVGFGFDVAAVAISTFIATLLSSSMLLVLLTHTKMAVHVSVRKLRIHWPILKEVLRVGVPAGVQSAVFSLSNIVIQAAINSLGPDVMAASAAAFNWEILAYIVVNGFGQACTTFVGQNYGAGDLKRCRKVGLITTAQNLTATVLIGGLLLYFSDPLIGLFTSDKTVIALGFIRMEYVLLAEPVNVLIEMISGFLRGFGDSLAPALVVVTGICGSRVIYVLTVFPGRPAFDTLMAVYPISWIITAAALVPLLVWKWRRIRGQSEEGRGKREE